jgi:hypothetical protein
VFVATVIVSSLLALAALGSGIGKLTKQAQALEPLQKIGVSSSLIPLLGIAELAGAIGLVVGFWVAALGIAAEIGLVLYFVGAVGAHLRVKDYQFQPAAALLLLSIAALVLRIVTR